VLELDDDVGLVSRRNLEPVAELAVSITSAIAAGLPCSFDRGRAGLPQTTEIVQTAKACSVVVDGERERERERGPATATVTGDVAVGRPAYSCATSFGPATPQLVPGPADVPFRRQREHYEIVRRQRPRDGHQPFRADETSLAFPICSVSAACRT